MNITIANNRIMSITDNRIVWDLVGQKIHVGNGTCIQKIPQHLDLSNFCLISINYSLSLGIVAYFGQNILLCVWIYETIGCEESLKWTGACSYPIHNTSSINLVCRGKTVYLTQNWH